jgi:hypothetical protein
VRPAPGKPLQRVDRNLDALEHVLRPGGSVVTRDPLDDVFEVADGVRRHAHLERPHQPRARLLRKRRKTSSTEFSPLSVWAQREVIGV